MGQRIDTTRQSILDNLANDWQPGDIRNLAEMLLALADSLEQRWEGPAPLSGNRSPSSLARIERDAYNLAQVARDIVDQRNRRKAFLLADLLGEPAWDMLLDLFVQYAGGAKVSTSSLCIASNVPNTTALRYISLLEKVGMIDRSPSQGDKRVTFVSLTPKGVLAMGGYLGQY